MPNNSKPNIRFKGFDQEWEEKRLDEMGDTYTGLSGKSKDDFGHGDGRYITYMNVFTNPIASPDEVGQIEIDNSQNQVKKGDILFTTSSETPDEVGMSSVWLEDKPNTYLNSFCFGYRPNVEIDPYFSAFLMRSPKVRENFYRLAQGISRFNISKQKAMEIGVEIPDPVEQQKIGSFFKALDELIAAKEEELEKLRQLKAALLEQMFPQSDADTTNRGGYNCLIDNYLQKSNMVISTALDTPRIRFKGFTEPWEKKKFGDYGNVSMCKRVMKHQTSVRGEIPFFKIGTFGKEADAYISRELFTYLRKNFEYPKKGDILISAAGTLGRSVVFDGQDQYFQDSNIVWLNHNGKLYNPFLKLSYGVVKWNSVEGSTLKRLYNSNILNTEFYVPSDKEQQKIGNFFRQQDEVINAAHEQIKKLSIIKQALLQKMFAA